MAFQGINMTFAGASGMMNANQARMDLANGVTGNEANIPSLAAQDKALMLQGEHAKILFACGQTMRDQAQRLRENNKKHQEARAQMGEVFGS
jgi:hypothetical protein